MTNTQAIVEWINERESIRMRKSILEDAPQNGGQIVLSRLGARVWGSGPAEGAWALDRLTQDPILRQYRFCNVRREDDRVTRWIRENIIVPYGTHENLWLMIAISRVINWPPTLRALMMGRTSWPWFEDFSPAVMAQEMQRLKDAGNKIYGAAYTIRAASSPTEYYFTWGKQRYISEIVIGQPWAARDQWQEVASSNKAEDCWIWLQQFVGWGSFMAGQFVADLRYTRYLDQGLDNETWTPLGPGSIRGLNRLHGRPLDKALPQSQGLEEILRLRDVINQPGTIWPWLQPLSPSNVQNCLCEVDKYFRVKLGEGRPKALYVPGRGS